MNIAKWTRGLGMTSTTAIQTRFNLFEPFVMLIFFLLFCLFVAACDDVAVVFLVWRCAFVILFCIETSRNLSVYLKRDFYLDRKFGRLWILWRQKCECVCMGGEEDQRKSTPCFDCAQSEPKNASSEYIHVRYNYIRYLCHMHAKFFGETSTKSRNGLTWMSTVLKTDVRHQWCLRITKM